MAWPIERTFSRRPRWVSITPFGSPVEPEVYCIRPSASGSFSGGSGAAWRSAESVVTVSTPSSVSTWLFSSTASARPSGTVISMRAPALRRITTWRRMCSSSCAMRAGG
jgi:hypothetical protein